LRAQSGRDKQEPNCPAPRQLFHAHTHTHTRTHTHTHCHTHKVERRTTLHSLPAPVPVWDHQIRTILGCCAINSVRRRPTCCVFPILSPDCRILLSQWHLLFAFMFINSPIAITASCLSFFHWHDVSTLTTDRATAYSSVSWNAMWRRHPFRDSLSTDARRLCTHVTVHC
jgi:hypothetical protein